MGKIVKGSYSGERPLFGVNASQIKECRFGIGESALKETRDIEVTSCVFEGKYPLWYGRGMNVKECIFVESARAGVWYTKNASFENIQYGAPKGFRRCKGLTLRNVIFTIPEETLWWNEGIRLQNVTVHSGTYFGKETIGADIASLCLNDSNYAFDGAKNVRIRHSKIISKDAFWNSEDCVLEDCQIEGEYFAWNSKNLTLIRCHITSLQGFCYIDGLTLIDCTFGEVDRSFEYCSRIDATIHSPIVSVKNPISGVIRAKQIGEIILDDPKIDHSKTEILVDESL